MTTSEPGIANLELLPSLVSRNSRSALQQWLVRRLEYLLREREEWGQRVAYTSWQIRLLDRAAFATYCDCLEQGVGAEARLVVALHRARHRRRGEGARDA